MESLLPARRLILVFNAISMEAAQRCDVRLLVCDCIVSAVLLVMHGWRCMQAKPLLRPLLGSAVSISRSSAGINACVTVGRLEEAQRAMDAMRMRSAPDLRAFNILIKGYSRAGDLAALQRTLQSIRQQVVTLHHLRHLQ